MTCLRGFAVLWGMVSILCFCVSAIDFICCLECSAALQISKVFSRVKSDSRFTKQSVT